MKTIKQLFVLVLLAGTTTFTSCKKEKIEDVAPAEDVASLVIGNYIGSGENASAVPFVNKVVKVSKVSNTRIKIESVSHTNITTFEVNVMKIGTDVTSTADENNSFAVQMAASPYTIAFENTLEETFGGTKQ